MILENWEEIMKKQKKYLFALGALALVQTMVVPAFVPVQVMAADEETQTAAATLAALSESDMIEALGLLAQKDYEKTGVLASVTVAQCLLESGYLSSGLSMKANNCFGMKTTLSGNTWPGSSWDGESGYSSETGEEYDGQQVTVTADFRAYDSIEASMADHSAYLLGAQAGDGLRYYGLGYQSDYRTAVQIIKDGGYATDSSYVDKVCQLIETYDLTRFDVLSPEAGVNTESEEKETEPEVFKPAEIVISTDISEERFEQTYDDELFRVRKEWKDADGEIGAFATITNAKKVCSAGYKVFDSQGNVIYVGR